MLSNKEIHSNNIKNFNKKGYKSTEQQFAKNQIVQTIESNKYNKSGLEAKKKFK